MLNLLICLYCFACMILCNAKTGNAVLPSLFSISESKDYSQHWQSQGKQLLAHHRSFPIAQNMHVQYPSLCKMLSCGHIDQWHLKIFFSLASQFQILKVLLNLISFNCNICSCNQSCYFLTMAANLALCNLASSCDRRGGRFSSVALLLGVLHCSHGFNALYQIHHELGKVEA